MDTKAPAAAETARNLSITWDRLESLLGEEKDLEPDERLPDMETLRRALHLVSEAAQQLSSTLPPASVSDNGSGDVYLSWRRPDRDLRLVVRVDRQAGDLIQHGQGSESEIHPYRSSADLACWLTWFVGA